MPEYTRKLAALLRWPLACTCLSLAGVALAHGDHGADDDDDEPAPAAVAATTPRVEVVVAREHGDLVIYIDDYASNAPIDGLQVQLRDSAQTLPAVQSGEGIYRLPTTQIHAPGDTPISLLLRGQGLDVQVQASMPQSAPATGIAPHAHRSGPVLIAAAFGIVLSGVLGWHRLRRRRAGIR